MQLSSYFISKLDQNFNIKFALNFAVQIFSHQFCTSKFMWTQIKLLIFIPDRNRLFFNNGWKQEIKLNFFSTLWTFYTICYLFGKLHFAARSDSQGSYDILFSKKGLFFGKVFIVVNWITWMRNVLLQFYLNEMQFPNTYRKI